MKLNKLIKIVIPAILMLSVSFMTTLALTPLANVGAADTTAKGSITVNAIGTVYVEPDMATMTFGVETRAANAGPAQNENSAKMQAVINALAAAGVDKKDMTTTGYNVYTEYSYTDGRSVPVGFVVSNSVAVTIRDIKKIGSIIDAAGKGGSNQMGGINFSVSNYDKLYNDALKLAVTQAKTKGDSIASALGVTITVPSSIIESGGYYNYVARAEAAMDASGGSTPIETGTSAVSASITATYEY